VRGRASSDDLTNVLEHTTIEGDSPVSLVMTIKR